MPHIHTETGQHDNTASAYIVRLDSSESKLLLIRHKKYQIYIQPGGHVELLETPWQAVLHELEEETGYARAQLTIMQPPDRVRSLDSSSVLHPLPVLVQTHEAASGPHFHTDTAYFFTTTELPKSKPHEGESQDLLWVDIGTMKDIAERTPMSLDAQNVFDFILSSPLDSWEKCMIAEFQA